MNNEHTSSVDRTVGNGKCWLHRGGAKGCQDVIQQFMREIKKSLSGKLDISSPEVLKHSRGVTYRHYSSLYNLYNIM